MKIKEKEKRRKLLEKSSLVQAGKYSKAVADEKIKQLTKAGRASLLKVRLRAAGGFGRSGWQDVGDLLAPRVTEPLTAPPGGGWVQPYTLRSS